MKPGQRNENEIIVKHCEWANQWDGLKLGIGCSISTRNSRGPIESCSITFHAGLGWNRVGLGPAQF